MKPEKNNTYCRYPFREVAIKNFEGKDLVAAWPCCMMGNIEKFSKIPADIGIKNVKDLTPQEIYDHPRFEKLRQNLKNGIRDPICGVCWNLEDRGMNSFRLISESRYHKDEDGLSAIDLTTSTACNLRCRMCTPSSSNSLMVDHRYFEKNGLLNEVKHVTKFWALPPGNKALSLYDSKQWAWLMENTDKITLLRASGGEPFYDKKIIKLLDKYIETGNAANTTISFLSNGTILDDEIIAKLNHFKNNAHNFSIDGSGKVYEYIRYPASFKQLDANLRNYREKIRPASSPLTMSMITSSLNVLDIPNYIEWGRSIDPLITINFAEVYGIDRGTAVKRLPIYILEQARDALIPYLTHPNGQPNIQVMHIKQHIENGIKHNEENKDMMLREIELFDMARNQSYKDYLPPVLSDWLSKK